MFCLSSDDDGPTGVKGIEDHGKKEHTDGDGEGNGKADEPRIEGAWIAVSKALKEAKEGEKSCYSADSEGDLEEEFIRL